MALRTFSSYKLYKKWLCIFFFNPVSAILLWRLSRHKWTTRYTWHAGICWRTRPWWTRRSQRRPGHPREDWAPGTTWCKWNERSEGRTWDPGSCRPKGRPGEQRRQWICSTGFIHELEGVCLEKTRRQGFRRNYVSHVILVREEIYFTNSQRSTIFSPQNMVNNFFLSFAFSTVPSWRSTQTLLSMFTLLVTLKRHRVAAAVVGCISPSMAMSVALLERPTVHSTRKQT